MTKSTMPARPHLSAGSHKTPEEGMCLMEYVSWKYGLGFSALPSCTEAVIAKSAQRINDRLPEGERQRLAVFADRLFAATPVSDPDVRLRVLIRVACWAARRVLDSVRDRDREVCERAIATAEAYLLGEASSAESAEAAFVAYTSTAATSIMSASYESCTALYSAVAASETAILYAERDRGDGLMGDFADTIVARATDAVAYSFHVVACSLDWRNLFDHLVEWFDDLLVQYDKAKAEEGA